MAESCPFGHACAVVVFVGAFPHKKNLWNEWKNHFYEMKGDVGMSNHEKKGN